jgi:U3 small nucleolar RNA-associated protein 22
LVLSLQSQGRSQLSSSSGSTNTTATLRIIPVATPDVFPLQRLAPTRNNLRSVKPTTAAMAPPTNNVTTEKKNEGDVDVSGNELVPTPYYNAGILQDMLMLEHSKNVQGIAAKARRVGEVSVLLRLWAQRHRLLDGADGVDGFFLTNLLAQLLQSGRAVSFFLLLNFDTIIIASSPHLISTNANLNIIFMYCSLLE